METPLLSICIPTWNRCGYLATLISKLHQEIESLPDPTDVEICVSDNASTDDTFLVCSRSSSNMLRYSRTIENIGLANFARVASMATGEYIWFMGDDDEPVSGGLGMVLAQIETCSDWYIQQAIVDHGNGIRTNADWVNQRPFGDQFDISTCYGFDAYATFATSLAAFGGLISCIVGKTRLLQEGFDATKEWGPGTNYPHVAALMHSVQEGYGVLELPRTHTIIYNQANDRGYKEPWERIMIDLEGWCEIGNRLGLRQDWTRPLRKHHGLHTLLTLSLLRDEPGNSWERANKALIRAGYSPETVELAGIIPYRRVKKAPK